MFDRTIIRQPRKKTNKFYTRKTRLKKKSIEPADNPKIKVGNIKEYICVKNNKTGNPSNVPIYYVYKDIEYDIDGWADSKKYLPEDFDLVLMKLERDKTIPGWINGSSWYGIRLKPNDQVAFWKRRGDEECL